MVGQVNWIWGNTKVDAPPSLALNYVNNFYKVFGTILPSHINGIPGKEFSLSLRIKEPILQILFLIAKFKETSLLSIIPVLLPNYGRAEARILEEEFKKVQLIFEQNLH